MGLVLALWISSLQAEVTPAYPGFKHINQYPVTTTQMLIPERAFRKLLRYVPLQNPFDEVFKWLGLVAYPQYFPKNLDIPSDFRMGLGRLDRYGTRGLTISCSGCHVNLFFGKVVVGMTNHFPRSNEFFRDGKMGLKFSNSKLFETLTGATPGELNMYRDMKRASQRIGIKKPSALGLDTSLAQVALSLARRNRDPWATFNSELENHPEPEMLASYVADSKPAVWWNLKYKTRWLSDGSIVSGDPIFTNLLWNEIGRGADLQELDQWFRSNEKVVRDLREAVFATESPRWAEFFGAGTIRVDRARRGSVLFHTNCARCHGDYRNGEVNYPRPTPVVDVGTDPGRREGMVSLARGLNPLALSQKFGTVIVPERGYVPPPLVGIFARYPYFHNNSVPSLCAVLTRSEDRPRVYYSRAQVDRDKDFDPECVGYPLTQGDLLHRFDTTKPGLSNIGHDEGVFLDQGREIYTPSQKQDIVEFLKTL